MSRDEKSVRADALAAKDQSRNKRQASVLLTEISRQNCGPATEKLIQDSTRLIEKSKKLRARAQELRNQKAS